MSNFITIENTNLATVTGGAGGRPTPRPTPRRGGGGDDYLNTYADPATRSARIYITSSTAVACQMPIGRR